MSEDMRTPVYGTAADELRDRLHADIERTAHAERLYTAWRNHVHACGECHAHCGCPAESVLWSAYEATKRVAS